MTWLKSGNFKNNFHIPELNRVVSYKNAFSERGVRSLELYGYCDGRLQIIVKVFDSSTYAALKEELIQRGFPKPDFMDDLFNIVRITQDDLVVLAQFLKVITRVDESFLESEKDIFRILNIDQPLAKVASLALSARESSVHIPVIRRRSGSLTENFKAKAKL